MKDRNGKRLTRGDYVYVNNGHGIFNNVGIFQSSSDSFSELMARVIINNRAYLKFPYNIIKMNKSEAMLWKLEHE